VAEGYTEHAQNKVEGKLAALQDDAGATVRADLESLGAGTATLAIGGPLAIPVLSALGLGETVAEGAMAVPKVVNAPNMEAAGRESRPVLNAVGETAGAAVGAKELMSGGGALPATDRTKVTTPVGELRAAKLKDAHHVIQNAAVRELPGYNAKAAPGVQLEGPANVPGTPHARTRSTQRQAGGGTYAAERRIGYKALRKSGMASEVARRAIQEADEYFKSIGVTPSTPTRIPADRR
jgi:hypothetical protein